MDVLGNQADVRRRVRFRVRSAYHPPATELLDLLFADRILEGVVVAESRGPDGGEFVVVALPGVSAPVIVSKSQLLDRG
jgi:hypothetical protein